MINDKTDQIIIKVDDDDIDSAINKALDETVKILISTYSPHNPSVSSDEVSSKNLPELALLKLRAKDFKYDAEWLNEVSRLVLENNRSTVNPDSYANVFPDMRITKTWAKTLLANLRTLLIVLWSQDTVILTVMHSLPIGSRPLRKNEEIKDFHTNKRLGSSGQYIKYDIAAPCYTELMQFFRKPFSNNAALNRERIPDLNAFFGEGEFNENIHSYIPRILIATDWHTIESVSTSEINAMSTFMHDSRNTDTGKRFNMPVSIKSDFAIILYKAYPDQAKFDLQSINNDKKSLKPGELRKSVEALRGSDYDTETEDSWLIVEEEYLHNIRYVRRLKSWPTEENTLGWLNKYLFETLPNAEVITPTPGSFSRKHLSRTSTTPSLYSVINKRDDIGRIQRFFDFLVDIGEIEKNPILDLDKPRERRRLQTAKAKFTITQFRLLFATAYALEEFMWHVAEKIAKNQLDAHLHQKWFNNLNKHSCLHAEEFGYVPYIHFYDVSRRLIQLPLKYIPMRLLEIYRAHFADGRIIQSPTLSSLHAFITALETGIRGIHVRWLDRNLLPQTPEHNETFDLIVNTDKANEKEWVRPTSNRVHTILRRQIESNSWYFIPWSNDSFFYDDHEETDYAKIYPIFLNSQEPGALKDQPLRTFTKEIYLFCRLLSKGLFGDESHKDYLPVLDEMEVDLNEPTTFELTKDFWDQTIKHTVHSLRSSVVSATAPLLPPKVIGGSITGQRSEDHVMYYTQIDSDYIEDAKAMNKLMLHGSNGLDQAYTVAIAAEKKGAALVEAFNDGEPEDIINGFGAFCFNIEKSPGELVSGIETLKDNFKVASVEPTHICPWGNQCPFDILKASLEKQCGQCWYSVKTIDHLPRILAHSHSLSVELDSLEEKLTQAAQHGASNQALEIIEADMNRAATELAAWIVTAEYLSSYHSKLQDDLDLNTTLIRKPELLKNKLILKESSSSLETMIVMCEEATSYPEYLSHEFESKVRKIRQQILIKTDRIAEALEDHSNLSLINNFRGIVASILKITGLSLNELDTALESTSIQLLPAIDKTLSAGTNE